VESPPWRVISPLLRRFESVLSMLPLQDRGRICALVEHQNIWPIECMVVKISDGVGCETGSD